VKTDVAPTLEFEAIIASDGEAQKEKKKKKKKKKVETQEDEFIRQAQEV